MMVQMLGVELQLLPEKAVYLDSLKLLLVSDVHLGKSETFQAAGVPIPQQVNQESLNRLQALCSKYQPEQLVVLGDLFHSRLALLPEVVEAWQQFLASISASVTLIVGNHDRALIPKMEQLAIDCFADYLKVDRLLLSHEPGFQPSLLNICGHVHPCVRLKTRLDDLRLPCFYYEAAENRLTLPSFGAFTGGYEVRMGPGVVAYAIAEGTIVPFSG